MKKLKFLLAGIVIAALGWTAWWFVGAAAHQKGIEGWLAQRQKAGWVAEAQSVSVTGFPARFDTLVEGLQLADPRAGWAWHAPEFQILSLAYKPNHIIAAWPGEQTFSTPAETVTAGGETLRGSVVFVPGTDLALDSSRIELADVTVRSSAGWTATVGKGLLAARRAEADSAPAHSYDIAFSAETVAIPDALRGLFDAADRLDPVLQSARIDSVVAFDRAWDRHAVEGPQPAITQIALREADIQWGALRLQAKGQVRINGQGQPEGRIDLTARNWKQMLAAAADAGAISHDLAATIETGLSVLSMLSGDRDTISVPLGLSGGAVKLGPIPIGRAPVFPIPAPQGG